MPFRKPIKFNEKLPKIISVIVIDDHKGLKHILDKETSFIDEHFRGKAPIHYAIQFRAERCLKILLEYGARSTNISKNNVLEDSAIRLAVTNGDKALVKILLDQPIDLYPPGRPILLPIFYNDDWKMLKMIHKFDPKIINYSINFWDNEGENTDGEGDQPIGRAIIGKAKHCTEYLIDKAIVEEQNEEMKKINLKSAILACIKHNKVKHLKHILSSVEEIQEYLQAVTRKGETYMHVATKRLVPTFKQKRNTQIIRMLAQYGAPVNERNRNGNTPLHQAKSIRVAKTLYDVGAYLNIENNLKQAPEELWNISLTVENWGNEEQIFLNEWIKLRKEKEKELREELLQAITDSPNSPDRSDMPSDFGSEQEAEDQ